MDISTEIQKFQITDAAIGMLADHYLKLRIASPDDKPGRSAVRTARLDIKNRRVSVEKTGKELRAEANAYNKAVITEEKRIIELLAPIEMHLIAEEERITTLEKQREAERVAAENARIAEEAACLKERISRLLARGAINNAYAVVLGKLTVPIELLSTLSDKQFDVVDAQYAQQEEMLDQLRAEAEQKAEAEKQVREAAQQKIAEERRKLEHEKAVLAEQMKKFQELEAAQELKVKQAEERLRKEEEAKAKVQAAKAEREAKVTTTAKATIKPEPKPEPQAPAPIVTPAPEAVSQDPEQSRSDHDRSILIDFADQLHALAFLATTYPALQTGDGTILMDKAVNSLKVIEVRLRKEAEAL